MYRYFKRFAGVGSASYIYFQKSKGLPDENNTAPTRISIHNSLNSSVKISKCSRNCNNINDTYAKLCVPDVVKNMNVKVFNLISRTNETRYIKWYVSANVDYMQVFVIIKKDGMKIYADVNLNSWLTKEHVTKDLIGILAVVNVSVVNHVILENI